jgi:hypothetical protein
MSSQGTFHHRTDMETSAARSRAAECVETLRHLRLHRNLINPSSRPATLTLLYRCLYLRFARFYRLYPVDLSSETDP